MDREMRSDLVLQNLVLKRKRSQRQCPWNLSSAEDDNVNGEQIMIIKTFSSSSMEVDEDCDKEEEHQAAECLMLLAQGKYQTQFNSLRVSDQSETLSKTRNSWLEKKINGGLYECKTCSRTFQSFQALGGHRTSHKKIKIRSEESVRVPQVPKPSEQSYNNVIAPVTLTPPKARVHECLICNAVFASGQALGGHMRRHRVVTIATEGQTSAKTETKPDGITLSLLSPALEETGNETSGSNNDFQCLDLNFPVAESDEIGESQLCLSSKQQELEDSGLVFSTQALVNCHY